MTGRRGPMEDPLDLQAIEARLLTMADQLKRDGGYRAKAGDEIASLLAYCRALRAALRPFVTQGAVVYIDSELPDDVVPQFCAQSVGDFRRAAATLALARDEEAAREAEPEAE